MLKVLRSGSALNALGAVNAVWSDVLEQATKFITAFYMKE